MVQVSGIYLGTLHEIAPHARVAAIDYAKINALRGSGPFFEAAALGYPFLDRIDQSS